ncbi:sigma 54-interacting transcriptional regulator, partial [bacterium]|nr:sigma 54-interacting transcriptional regulator [bacterium]
HERPETRHPYSEIVGKSRKIAEPLRLLDRAVETTATVLVLGESGTGKELVARAIHSHGARSAGPFVPLSCAALTDSLLESELFGHAAGAFTGAVRAHTGAFERASGGVLFLDELQDASPKLQADLLRVLETGEVRPLGGHEVRKVDVRVVAASNADLAALVTAGSFREDLYYRVNVFTIALPPLRERLDDIPDLVAHLLARAGQADRVLAPGVMERLLADPWSGNVRALKNCIDRALALAGPGPIRPEHVVLEAPLRREAPPLPERGSVYAGSVELNDSQLALIDRLRAEGEIRNADYAEHERVSNLTAWRDLSELVAKGVLVRVGRGKKTTYRLAPGWEARIFGS